MKTRRSIDCSISVAFTFDVAALTDVKLALDFDSYSPLKSLNVNDHSEFYSRLIPARRIVIKILTTRAARNR